MASLKAQSNLTISFGLVNIGVSIQKMVEDDNAPEGHLFCGEHKAGLTQQYVCQAHGEVVAHVDRITGYEWNGKMVYLGDGDKKACESEKDKRIALTRYVPIEDIDPLYFTDKSYFVWAQKGHDDGFSLLAEELAETGRALVGKCVLNKTTRILILRWSHEVGTMVAHLAQYDANIRRNLSEDIKAKAKPANAAGKALVKTVMDSLAGEFDPATLDTDDDGNQVPITDEYNDRLRAMLTAKAGGSEYVPAPVEAAENVPDIMAALRASVAEVAAEKVKA